MSGTELMERVGWTREKCLAGLDCLEYGLAPIADWRVFVMWRLIGRESEKPRKVPYLPDGSVLKGAYTDPKLPERLGALTEVLKIVRRNGSYAGIGVAFYPNCGLVGLDLDKCVIGGRPELREDQKAAIKIFRTHSLVEISVSGTGLHALACGKARTLKANGSIELFGDCNFLALTGTVVRGAEQIKP